MISLIPFKSTASGYATVEGYTDPERIFKNKLFVPGFLFPVKKALERETGDGERRTNKNG